MWIVALVVLAQPPFAHPPIVQAPLHQRLATDRGPVHVLNQGSERVVIYVHGYYTDADEAWPSVSRQLGDQPALFIMPEAPSGPRDPVLWPELGALLERVTDAPPTDVTVIGHSGAYRTIKRWLDDPRVSRIILLDAIYGDISPFVAWANAGTTGRRLILVSRNTWRSTRALLDRVASNAVFDAVPGRAEDVDSQADVLCFRSQYDHFAIVESGAVIPVMLAL